MSCPKVILTGVMLTELEVTRRSTIVMNEEDLVSFNVDEVIGTFIMVVKCPERHLLIKFGGSHIWWNPT